MNTLPRSISICLLSLLCALLMVPEICQAEVITITPDEWNFGQVAVGDTSTKTIILESSETTPIQIFSLQITDDPYGAFALVGTDPDPIPTFLFQNQTVDALVSFTPPFEGSFSANLLIHSNDHAREFINVPLSGTTTAVPEPSSLALFALIGLVGLTFCCWRAAGGNSRSRSSATSSVAAPPDTRPD